MDVLGEVVYAGRRMLSRAGVMRMPARLSGVDEVTHKLDFGEKSTEDLAKKRSKMDQNYLRGGSRHG
jgi:hypothetical protein